MPVARRIQGKSLTYNSNQTRNPLWDFAIEMYARPGVEAACLRLQDEAGLDVMLLLFCLWLAAAGYGRIGAAELVEAMAATRRWREDVIQPLRRVRRALKGHLAGVPAEPAAALRRDIGACELAAERISADLLFGCVRRAPDAAVTPAASARANLDDYVAAAGARLTEPLTYALALLARAGG
jgi:uncharacterized protein (TIGR02444 family)